MPSHQEYKRALQLLQSRRLRRDHADLSAEPEFSQLGEFFFEEVYGPRDFSARDEQAHRLRMFVHMAPGLAVRDVEQVLALMELTTRLDDSVAACMVALGLPIDFDEALYERAYRMADNYAERLLQLDLVRGSLYNVYRLTHQPLIGVALQRTQGFAEVVGMADLHRFMRLGYQALRSVRDIYRFVETIYLREKDRLDRIYELGG